MHIIKKVSIAGGIMLFSEFRCKEVINVRDCRRLGKVADFEFDHCTGQIKKIIIPGACKFCNFFCSEPDIVICYNEICQVGPDIILVNIKI